MNDLCAEIGYKSINHYGEQLCGDHVEIAEQDENSSVIVLADGMGSGGEAAREGAELLVLDEAVSACNHGVIPEAELLDFLRHKPEGLEVAVTGRNPSEALMAEADYITEMVKRRHPFDRGIAARRGVEF